MALARGSLPLAAAAFGVFVLAVVSMLVGVSDVTLPQLAVGDPDAWGVLWISRVPRTLAVVLSGLSLAVAGLVMQMMARNRFVEPSTVGTVESAMLGLLAVSVLAPGLPILGRMGVASVFALGGTALFLALVRRVPARSSLLIPLVGIMLGGVVQAVTTFFAYQFNLLQAVNGWMFGDFSGVLRGRYELLWVVGAVALAGYLAADRLTLVGMGREFTANLGVNYDAALRLGLVIVSLIAAVTVTTVGALPFLGLVVPNVVSLITGDSLRRAVPWTAVLGAGLVLACDLAARLLRYPFEVPVGLVLSVVGAGAFLVILLRRPAGGRA